jgi:hypothetical protein
MDIRRNVVHSDYCIGSANLGKGILTFMSLHFFPCKRTWHIAAPDWPKTISGKIRRVQLRALKADLARNQDHFLATGCIRFQFPTDTKGVSDFGYR